MHKERGIKDSFFWAFVHNLSFFTSLLSQARVMNQVCTALIFSPRRVANNERKRCISPPILKFLSHKSRLAPLYTQPPCKKQSNYVFIFRLPPFYAVPPSTTPRGIVFDAWKIRLWFYILYCPLKILQFDSFCDIRRSDCFYTVWQMIQVWR